MDSDFDSKLGENSAKTSTGTVALRKREEYGISSWRQRMSEVNRRSRIVIDFIYIYINII